MPVIHADTLIEGRPADEAWEVVKNAEALAARARHVVAVRPGPARDKAFRVNEWTVLLNGSEVSWVQREAAGPGYRLRFEQLSGELEHLSGEWSVAPEPGGARVTLTLTFDLGVDGLAPLLDPIWSQSFQAHAEELLRVVAESAA
ncbi:type II toxin-antitoxin system RatA family toxin [Streptomyces sp. TRM64462]|uniref:type II toxin-antitoxin system RatA family toxin n=1 Tax=Streptomyces sp. TRM64462 TaxID=2741726 RepID=UPI001586A61E|nr:SRPBCC family protein [Streptomyces sp. TRM64462]